MQNILTSIYLDYSIAEDQALIGLFQKVDSGAVAGFGSYEYEVVYQARARDI
jgi:hypothetical protein